MKAFLCLCFVYLAITLSVCERPYIKKASQLSKSFFDDLKQRCNQENIISIERATVNFRNCINDTLNFETGESEFIKAKQDGKLNAFRDKYCGKRAKASQCLNTFLTAYGPCLKKKEDEIKKTVTSLFTGLTNFICEEDFNKLPDLLNSNSENCVRNSLPLLKNCYNENLKSIFATQPRMFWAISRLITTRKYCKELRGFEECTIKAFNECFFSYKLVNFYIRFINTLEKESACKNAKFEETDEREIYNQNNLDYGEIEWNK